MAKRTLQELTKESREMEERFMILEEMLRDERAAGRREERQSILRSFLEDLGSIPPELEKKLFEDLYKKSSNSLLDCQVILCFWIL